MFIPDMPMGPGLKGPAGVPVPMGLENEGTCMFASEL